MPLLRWRGRMSTRITRRPGTQRCRTGRPDASSSRGKCKQDGRRRGSRAPRCGGHDRTGTAPGHVQDPRQGTLSHRTRSNLWKPARPRWSPTGPGWPDSRHVRLSYGYVKRFPYTPADSIKCRAKKFPIDTRRPAEHNENMARESQILPLSGINSEGACFPPGYRSR
ncbi:hypothetical protein SPHINGOT1_20102 [Sphingomonas sp. T1]|nr:hypothetical protein SPHINGOT1_20102 [Sphingomonas sp. T1]